LIGAALTSPAEFPRLLASVVDDIEGDLGVFDQAIEACLPDRSDVNEHV
jgi:hypothetical protein